MGAPPSFDPHREAERMLAAIVESTDDAIFAKSVDGTILTWNRGASHMYGPTAQEIVGRPVRVLVPPDRLEELEGILARAARGEAVEHLETVRQTKDGRRIDVSLSVAPILDASGQVIGSTAIAQDITA